MTCECGRPLIAGQDECWKCSGDSPVPPWWRPTFATSAAPVDRHQWYYVTLGNKTFHLHVVDGFIWYASNSVPSQGRNWDWVATE